MYNFYLNNYQAKSNLSEQSRPLINKMYHSMLIFTLDVDDIIHKFCENLIGSSTVDMNTTMASTHIPTAHRRSPPQYVKNDPNSLNFNTLNTQNIQSKDNSLFKLVALYLLTRDSNNPVKEEIDGSKKIESVLLEKFISSYFKEQIVTNVLKSTVNNLINPDNNMDLIKKVDLSSLLGSIGGSLNSSSPPISNENISDNNLLKQKRASSKISACPHVFRKHYAKNMCSNCYHRQGRTKQPWRCSHINKPLYALGYCQNCYQNKYTKSKKIKELDISNCQDSSILENGRHSDENLVQFINSSFNDEE